MRTVKDIFENVDDEIVNHPAVKELIDEYEHVGDQLIDLQQSNEFSKEDPLKELVSQIKNSIQTVLKRDEDAIRFKETDRVDFKEAVINLHSYIQQYCRDYKIYL